MRFVNPLPFVSDIPRSTVFYRDVIGLRVLEAHDDFVRFEGGFAIHDGGALLQSIFDASPTRAPCGRDNFVLYFQTDDLAAAFERVSAATVIIHPIRRLDWGGHVFRARDPDQHIIEVGTAP